MSWVTSIFRNHRMTERDRSKAFRMIKPEIPKEHGDFSLVLGGPLFQLYRWARLSGAALELGRRRVIVFATVCWLPLLLLSVIGGHAFGGIEVPFLYDLEVHVRFLIAAPILIAAELAVHLRIRPAVKKFVERGIVVPEDMSRFQAAIDSATRLRNSKTAEVVLLILVYTLGLWVWRNEIATGVSSWYGTSEGSQWHLTVAGYWYAFVSIPMFQFILLRWYLRFFIWFQFLWRVSKLNLTLIAAHPDRASGLGFLGTSTYAFAPILFAHGALLSAMIASRVRFDGQALMAFKPEVVALVAVFTFFSLSPLLLFSPHLARAKRKGLRDYGRLANRYVQAFERKWIDRSKASEEELLGNADIQSLADFGNSFAVVQETRLVPFAINDVVRLVAVTVLPLLPLLLTVVSLEELVLKLLKILF